MKFLACAVAFALGFTLTALSTWPRPDPPHVAIAFSPHPADTTADPTTTTTEPPPVTTTTVPVMPAPVAPVITGPRSYAWWEAIALCESGNTNGWRTGYYGIEADYPIGHLSKDEQLAWAQDIYRNYGDGAWGCAPVAWRMVPSG